MTAHRAAASRGPEAGHDDPGLQPERTILAWTRTLLALIACALLFLRWLPTHGAVTLAPLAVALLGGGLIVATRRRTAARAVRAIREGQAVPALSAILALTALVLLVGAGAIVGAVA